jgi:hypothetical protein
MTVRRAGLLGIMLLAAGCTRSAPPPPPTPTIQLFTPSIVESTPTLIATSLATAPVTPSLPTLTLTPGPFTPFVVHATVEPAKLHIGPGYLFDTLRLALKGDNLTVKGQAPGGEWIQVEMEDGSEGWIYRGVLEENPGFASAPVIEPEDVQLLRAKITDNIGLPISGIQFALTLGDIQRTDAVSDLQGDLYFYLPADVTGDWLLSYVAIACTSNAYVDNSCSAYKQGYTGTVQPDTRPVTLPTDNIITFQWQ